MLNIVSKNQIIKNHFLNRVLLPFKILNFPIEEYLEGWTVYLGLYPDNDSKLFHVDILEYQIVLPYYYSQNFGYSERYLDIDGDYTCHELGHLYHLDEWGYNRKFWNIWAEKTENKVELIRVNDRVQTPSFENFANDFKKIYWFNLDSIYFDILGISQTIDYITLNSCEKAKGLVDAKIIKSVQESVFKKYQGGVQFGG